MPAEPARFDTEVARRAIAHPGRRKILALVSEAGRSSSELAEACGWSRPAASQHLKVLLDAGLVEVTRRGNNRVYRARATELDRLRAFLDEFWRERLGALGDQLAGSDDIDGSAASGAEP